MCVKLSLGDLNPDPCILHSRSIYTCRVIIASNVYGGSLEIFNNKLLGWIEFKFVLSYC